MDPNSAYLDDIIGSMQKLLLIDGHAMIHRAYHAYPPNFTDKQGNPVNAVYGFFAMLIKLLQEVQPEYMAICFDMKAPTFRQALFAGYQQGRPAITEDLGSQITVLQDSLRAVGIPLFGIEGYEADDLIGTISKKAVSLFQKTRNTQIARKSDKSESQEIRHTEFSEYSDSIEVIIVTGDRDLLQLVNEHVKVLMPLVGITKTALFGEKEVEDKFGVKPSQFIDYKALVGDQSDGYPGVNGIGPKGAANLLQKFGSFENIYKHLSELPVQLQEKLATDAEQASLAKKLATIATDAPAVFDLKKCDHSHFATENFLPVFEKFGFASLAKRIMENDKGSIINDKKEIKSLEKSEKKKEGKQLGLL